MRVISEHHVRTGGGGLRGVDDFVGKFRLSGRWRNFPLAKGVSASAGAHAPRASDLPAQGSLGRVGGVHTPMLLGPARVPLGWEDRTPPRRSPSAAPRRRFADTHLYFRCSPFFHRHTGYLVL